MVPYLFSVLLFLAAPAIGQTLVEEHLYRERRDTRQSAFTWRLEQKDDLVLSAIGGGETFICHLAPDLSTRRWEVQREGEGTAIVVERRGNELHLSGRLRGEPVRRVLAIDAAPWYQALSISLRSFLAGRGDPLEFWSLRPDTLEPVRLLAVMEGTERVAAAGAFFAAQRVQVRPTGLGALVWRGRYWFRRDDGLFLRFEAPGGLPGSPLTVIELAK